MSCLHKIRPRCPCTRRRTFGAPLAPIALEEVSTRSRGVNSPMPRRIEPSSRHHPDETNRLRSTQPQRLSRETFLSATAPRAHPPARRARRPKHTMTSTPPARARRTPTPPHDRIFHHSPASAVTKRTERNQRKSLRFRKNRHPNDANHQRTEPQFPGAPRPDPALLTECQDAPAPNLDPLTRLG